MLYFLLGTAFLSVTLHLAFTGQVLEFAGMVVLSLLSLALLR